MVAGDHTKGSRTDFPDRPNFSIMAFMTAGDMELGFPSNFFIISFPAGLSTMVVSERHRGVWFLSMAILFKIHEFWWVALSAVIGSISLIF